MHNDLMRIGIDLLGSDAAPKEIVKAVLEVASDLPKCQFVLFGQEAPSQKSSQISFVKADTAIEMTDAPLVAVRKKQTSSMIQGIKALKEGTLDAFISCGNTGALLTAATMYIPTLPSISRPALLAEFPSQKGTLTVLDVGASVEVTATRLVEFAHLGAAYCSTKYALKKPRVALLNIGAESQKGTKELQKAFQLLSTVQQDAFHFVGNIEPRDCFNGKTDVLVTNGFAGNIFLKTAEGIASFILSKIPKNQSIFLDLQADLEKSASQGALLAGLEKLVFKCHGDASRSAIIGAILAAERALTARFVDIMTAKLV